VGGLTRRAVFLDRDGTLNVRAPEHEYVTSVRDFVWIPGAREAAARFAHAGFVLTVVSNQRGVARGIVKPEALAAIEQRIQHDLAPYDCAVEAFRYCIHNDADACDCRKPKPGMLLDLAQRLDLDLGASWMIGDAESDVRAGEAAGCATALIGENLSGDRADVVAASLIDASELIVARESVQV
jgi:D-glycero-D-manno-heptose 1,7-bisphosphate phosphatase